jgi:hypothetical protein
MIIRIAMTDEQLSQIFCELGYTTEKRDLPVAVQLTHGLTRVECYPRLHVLVSGQWTEAHPYFEQLLDKSLMQIIKSFSKSELNNK